MFDAYHFPRTLRGSTHKHNPLTASLRVFLNDNSSMAQKTKLERFENEVISRFNLYNSVFSTLPYSHISKTATLLPFFAEFCALGFDQNKNPIEIVDEFFKQYYPNNSEKENVDTLFRLIQFIERQVVLFDAIEDAAFTEINNFSGRGTLRSSK